MVDTTSRSASGTAPADGGEDQRPTVKPNETETARRRPMSGAGYIVAIIVNAILLIVVNNLLAWDLLPFLTGEFGQVLWLIDISLLATIVVNIVYLGYDPGWFKSVCQIGLGGISMAVAIRMYQVFPFDFTGSQFDWTWIARFVLVLAVVGTGIGIFAELVKLAQDLARRSGTGPQ